MIFSIFKFRRGIFQANQSRQANQGDIKKSKNNYCHYHRVVCRCDHLTNFAILVSPVNVQMGVIHERILTALSLICCIVSIVFLVLGITVFIIILYNESRRTLKYIIHVNFMLALFISQLLFVAGSSSILVKSRDCL